MKNKFNIQIEIFILLNILDAFLTYIVLSGENVAGEINPIYNFLFESFGIAEGLVILKIFGIISMMFIYYILIEEKYRIKASWVLICINIFYILIVINNLYWVLRKFYIL